MKLLATLFGLQVMLLSVPGFGQTGPENAGRLEEGKFIIRIDLSWNEQQRATLAELFDLDSTLMAAVFTKNIAFITDSTEWNVIQPREGVLEIAKKLDEAPDVKLDKIILSAPPEHTSLKPPLPVQANYGINNFSYPTVFSYNNGKACFTLKGIREARTVYLAGSFNQWSTLQTPMQKTDSGWVACVWLPPGKHLYKFVVDGRWMNDPNNALRENDGHRGFNSIVYCYNYTFNLLGYTNARRVVLAGSFNGWNRRELEMKKNSDGWTLPMFLREGTHAYKFIVDGNWINDPANPVTRPDGAGNVNSFIGIGDTLVFRLRGYTEAAQVVLSANFNAWNTGELFMGKTDDGWTLPYVLAAGNYEYKFIVDGRWITDPDNPFTTGAGDFTNSFLSFKPNHLFVLKGYSNADRVIVTGSFNGWNRKEYRMVLRDDEWVFPIYLAPGRHSYKFIINGTDWILDPANPLWEQNEFGSGNSVLWVE